MQEDSDSDQEGGGEETSRRRRRVSELELGRKRSESTLISIPSCMHVLSCYCRRRGMCPVRHSHGNSFTHDLFRCQFILRSLLKVCLCDHMRVHVQLKASCSVCVCVCVCVCVFNEHWLASHSGCSHVGSLLVPTCM